MSNLPDGWVTTTIGEVVAYVQRGKSPKYTDCSELPVINQKCIRWNRLEIQYLKFIHPEQISAWDSARYIRVGDILWNSTGTGTVGRAYLVSEADCIIPKVVDSHVTIVRTCDEVESRYVFNWIKGPIVQQKIEEMCDGTTNQIELSRQAITKTEIPLAPLNEQKRIAEKLDRLLERVDACRAHLDRIPLLLKRFRQSVLAAATSGRLTADWRETQGSTFNKWQLHNFGDLIFELRNGWGIKPTEEADGKAILRISSVRPFSVNFKDIRFLSSDAQVESYLLQTGDLLFTRYNGTLEFVGVCALVRELPSFPVVYPDKLIRVRVDETQALPSFIEITINAPATRIIIEDLAKTSAGQTGISGKDLKGLRLLVPTLEEQAEIVRRVESLFAYGDRLEARYQAARAQVEKLTPALLAKAFRGELVPQDPNDEPASVLLERIRATRAATPKPQRAKRR